MPPAEHGLSRRDRGSIGAALMVPAMLLTMVAAWSLIGVVMIDAENGNTVAVTVTFWRIAGLVCRGDDCVEQASSTNALDIGRGCDNLSGVVYTGRTLSIVTPAWIVLTFLLSLSTTFRFGFERLWSRRWQTGTVVTCCVLEVVTAASAMALWHLAPCSDTPSYANVPGSRLGAVLYLELAAFAVTVLALLFATRFRDPQWMTQPPDTAETTARVTPPGAAVVNDTVELSETAAPHFKESGAHSPRSPAGRDRTQVEASEMTRICAHLLACRTELRVPKVVPWSVVAHLTRDFTSTDAGEAAGLPTAAAYVAPSAFLCCEGAAVFARVLVYRLPSLGAALQAQSRLMYSVTGYTDTPQVLAVCATVISDRRLLELGLHDGDACVAVVEEHPSACDTRPTAQPDFDRFEFAEAVEAARKRVEAVGGSVRGFEVVKASGAPRAIVDWVKPEQLGHVARESSGGCWTTTNWREEVPHYLLCSHCGNRVAVAPQGRNAYTVDGSDCRTGHFACNACWSDGATCRYCDTARLALAVTESRPPPAVGSACT
jgi:hypothetical protein